MNTYYDYLFSTAYIETAVSKLLETQAKKLNILSEKGLPAEQINELNKTLKEQLKKLEYLHLLLYNKTVLLRDSLEVWEPDETGDDACCLQTSPKKDAYDYIFNCKSQNTVSNPHDPYRDGYSMLDAYVFIPKPKRNNFLSYSVSKGTKMLDLFSQPADMKAGISFGAGQICIRIKGTASVMIKESGKQSFQTCGFVLDVISDDIPFTKTAYKMKVFAVDTGIVLHDSGLIQCAASLLK